MSEKTTADYFEDVIDDLNAALNAVDDSDAEFADRLAVSRQIEACISTVEKLIAPDPPADCDRWAT